jgi:hypothetical protein
LFEALLQVSVPETSGKAEVPGKAAYLQGKAILIAPAQRRCRSEHRNRSINIQIPQI